MCDGAGRARTVDTRAAAYLVGLALGAGLMAEVLASGEFDDVPLANATPSDVDAAVEEMTSGMGVSSRTVNLLDIDRTGDDDTRTATFELIWDLPDTDDEWAYTTTASLSFTGEGVAGRLDPVGAAPAARRRHAAHTPHLAGRARRRARSGRHADRYRAPGLPDRHRQDHARRSGSRQLGCGASRCGLRGTGRIRRPGRGVRAPGVRGGDHVPRGRRGNGAAGVDGIAGARGAIPGTMALATTREFARPVLGTVGEATAEIVEESGGQISPGDVVGLSGLQEQYDEQLRGQRGIAVEVVPADGDPEVVFERDASPGQPVTTTLDVDLQLPAESVLADVGPASALVAVQPSTGNVVAAATGLGGDGYATLASTRRDPLSRSFLRSRCCARESPRTRSWPAPRPRPWTASASRTTTTTLTPLLGDHVHRRHRAVV